MSAKAPSEGTKVTAGQNAPVTNEGPGAVPAGSLASESAAFKSANQADSNTSGNPAAGPGQSGSGGSGANAGAAPSYVENQYHRDPAGPHGKNLTEDPSLGTGDDVKNASMAPIGSKDDPALAAENKIAASTADTSTAGSQAGRETQGDGKTTYSALGETSA
ncbi:hypothetical protein F4780DRAFT_32381 [Xylariomycetidae sp. FL0641]|nr:hypothetical protein F4780DRAFT_32381 [Xylariomycetidae sp. FL0641]